MTCDQYEPVIEALADGTLEPGDDARAHLASCRRCEARLDQARRIEQWLVTRETPAPPPSFTQTVMARIGRERWQAERVVDLGFNLAIAAGVLIILVGAAGLAWSLGFLTVTIDFEAVLAATRSELGGRVVSQAQTVAMAAVLLTFTLGLWWWAETDSSY